MDEFLTLAVALKAVYTAVAIVVALYFSAWLDRRARVNFRDMIARLVAEPHAAAIYYGLRFLAICLLIGMLVGCSSASAGTLFPSRYDAQIRAAVERHWADHPDWLAWRAQLYQESRLRPEAVSPVGASPASLWPPGGAVRTEARHPASNTPGAPAGPASQMPGSCRARSKAATSSWGGRWRRSLRRGVMTWPPCASPSSERPAHDGRPTRP